MINIDKEKLENFIKENRTPMYKENRTPMYKDSYVQMQGKPNSHYRIVRLDSSLDFLKALNFDVDEFVSETIKYDLCQKYVSRINQLEHKVRETIDYRKDLVQSGGNGYAETFSDDVLRLYRELIYCVREVCWILNEKINENYFNGRGSLIRDLSIIDEIESVIYWMDEKEWIDVNRLVNDFKVVKNVFEEFSIFHQLTASERTVIFPQLPFVNATKNVMNSTKNAFVSSDFAKRLYNLDENIPSVNFNVINDKTKVVIK